MAGESNEDRRRYPRVHAPMLVRPVGLVEHARARSVRDVSLGGIRTFADESIPPGRRLEVELFFEDSTSATLQVRVAWTTALPDGAAARFEVGLEILQARPDDLARLGRALRGSGGRARGPAGD